MRATNESVENQPAAAAGNFSFLKLFKDILVYSSGNILIKGMSIISAPIFTRIFNTAEYGAWGFITSIVAFLTGILLLGGDSAYTRYFFECKTDEERQAVTSTWFAFLAVWSYVVVLALLPFSRQITLMLLEDLQYQAAWTIGLAVSPLAMLNLLLSQALRNQFRAKAFSVLNVLTAALTLALSVLFALRFDLGINGALLGAGAASLVMIPVRLWYIRDLLKWRFSRVFLKKLLNFGIPLVPVTLAFWLFSNADRVMLVKMASLEEVGLYIIASSMVAVLMLLHNGLGQSWLPHAMKLYEDDPEEAKITVGRTMNYFLAGAGIVVIGFVALSQEVLYVMVPPVYYDAFQAIPFLAVGIFFFMTTQVTVVGILVKNKTVFIMVACGFLALANIGFNYLFIPRWGIAGAGVATGLSYLLLTAGYALISGRLWPIAYHWGGLARLLLFILPSLGLVVATALFVENPWLSFGLKAAVVILCTAALGLVLCRLEGLGLKDAFGKLAAMRRAKAETGV